jgi:hypothetical protein
MRLERFLMGIICRRKRWEAGRKRVKRAGVCSLALRKTILSEWAPRRLMRSRPGGRTHSGSGIMAMGNEGAFPIRAAPDGSMLADFGAGPPGQDPGRSALGSFCRNLAARVEPGSSRAAEGRWVRFSPRLIAAERPAWARLTLAGNTSTSGRVGFVWREGREARTSALGSFFRPNALPGRVQTPPRGPLSFADGS